MLQGFEFRSDNESNHRAKRSWTRAKSTEQQAGFRYCELDQYTANMFSGALPACSSVYWKVFHVFLSEMAMDVRGVDGTAGKLYYTSWTSIVPVLRKKYAASLVE